MRQHSKNMFFLTDISHWCFHIKILSTGLQPEVTSEKNLGKKTFSGYFLINEIGQFLNTFFHSY